MFSCLAAAVKSECKKKCLAAAANARFLVKREVLTRTATSAKVLSVVLQLTLPSGLNNFSIPLLPTLNIQSGVNY